LLVSGIGRLPGLHGQGLFELCKAAKLANPSLFIVVDTMHPGQSAEEGAGLEWLGDSLESIDVICTSVSEGQIITAEETASSMAFALREWDAHTVVIKQGAEGITWLEDGQMQPEHISAYPIQREVDGTGAGDGFCGVLAAFLGMRSPLRTCIRAAAIAGATIALNGRGTSATPTFAELSQLEQDWV
jgi:sugar/nucleoside kinase (ribokinase family)